MADTPGHLGGACLAVVAGLALVSCSVGGGRSPDADPPTAQPLPTIDPATVESAVVHASNCSVHPRYGRDLDSISFLLFGVGASAGDPPHQPLDGSFVCNVDPAGTLSVGAAHFGDPAQAIEVVNWFRGGVPCRPVAVIGPWMLFSARAIERPQVSPELEAAVAELGGQMTATCR